MNSEKLAEISAKILNNFLNFMIYVIAFVLFVGLAFFPIVIAFMHDNGWILLLMPITVAMATAIWLAIYDCGYGHCMEFHEVVRSLFKKNDED